MLSSKEHTDLMIELKEQTMGLISNEKRLIINNQILTRIEILLEKILIEVKE